MGRLQKNKSSYLKKRKKSSSLSKLPEADKNSVIKKIITSGEKTGIPKTIRASSENKVIIKINEGLQFLREVNLELKKVTWPTRKQTIGLTVVVVLFVLIISLFLGIVDISLSSLIRLILQ